MTRSLKPVSCLSSAAFVLMFVLPAAGQMVRVPGIRMSGEGASHFGKHRSSLSGPNAFVAIDKMVATIAPLGLAQPVLIQPPTKAGGNWTAKSAADNRPLDVDLVLDGKTGAILKRTGFDSKPLIDRMVGTGIAAHEGQLFGVANQILSLLKGAAA